MSLWPAARTYRNWQLTLSRGMRAVRGTPVTRQGDFGGNSWGRGAAGFSVTTMAFLVSETKGIWERPRPCPAWPR